MNVPTGCVNWQVHIHEVVLFHFCVYSLVHCAKKRAHCCFNQGNKQSVLILPGKVFDSVFRAAEGLRHHCAQTSVSLEIFSSANTNLQSENGCFKSSR